MRAKRARKFSLACRHAYRACMPCACQLGGALCMPCACQPGGTLCMPYACQKKALGVWVYGKKKHWVDTPFESSSKQF